MKCSQVVKALLIAISIKSQITALPIDGDFSYDSLCKQYEYKLKNNDKSGQLATIKEILYYADEDLKNSLNVDFINNDLSLNRFNKLKKDLELDLYFSKRMEKSFNDKYEGVKSFVKNNPEKIASCVTGAIALGLIYKKRKSIVNGSCAVANFVKTKTINTKNYIAQTRLVKGICNVGSKIVKAPINATSSLYKKVSVIWNRKKTVVGK